MSQREMALQQIRAALLSGKVPVGERTSERLFTEKYLDGSGLGRTPVREALAILTQLGIVEQYPQAGFSVRRVDATEATKALALQAVTGRLVVRAAATTGGGESDLLALVDTIASAASHGGCAAVLESTRAFHMNLARSAGYATAADVIGGFRDRYGLFIIGTRSLDQRELSETASVYRDLELAIEADTTGEKGEQVLSRLIQTETDFVAARHDWR